MKQIEKRAKISLFLDCRRVLNDGTYPIKLRVYFGKPQLYDTDRSLTKEDFDNSYLTAKPKGDYYQGLKIELSQIEANANEVVDGLKKFSFEKFYKILFATKRSLTNIVDHYADYVIELERNDQVGSAICYRCSINSIKEYVNSYRSRPSETITFDTITPQFLKSYENWMIAQGNSRTTVGIYLRTTRRIFNVAIEAELIERDIYPFKKYKIPNGKKTKKAIEMPDLKALFEADCQGNVFQEKAKAFWFFSYQCNGMNIRDIAELKFKNFQKTHFSFLRQKTIRTTQDDPRPIIVPITPFVKEVIDRYGNLKNSPNDYVFPIFNAGMNAKEKLKANQNFTRFINQHMKKLAEQNKLEIKTGTMEARHSFTTHVTRRAGLEFAQEALGHTTISTTQNYWAGFETETKQDMAKMLMSFADRKPLRKIKAG